jgi:hypothetical protein
VLNPVVRRRTDSLAAKIRAEDGLSLACDLIEQELRT